MRRVLRIAAWGVLGLAVVLAGASAMPLKHAGAQTYLELGRGRVIVGRAEAPLSPQFLAAVVDGTRMGESRPSLWRPRWISAWASTVAAPGRVNLAILTVPIGVPVAGLGALGGIGLMLTRTRRRAGECSCGYDIRGLTKCPECGVVVKMLRAILARALSGRGGRASGGASRGWSGRTSAA